MGPRFDPERVYHPPLRFIFLGPNALRGPQPLPRKVRRPSRASLRYRSPVLFPSEPKGSSDLTPTALRPRRKRPTGAPSRPVSPVAADGLFPLPPGSIFRHKARPGKRPAPKPHGLHPNQSVGRNPPTSAARQPRHPKPHKASPSKSTQALNPEPTPSTHRKTPRLRGTNPTSPAPRTPPPPIRGATRSDASPSRTRRPGRPGHVPYSWYVRHPWITVCRSLPRCSGSRLGRCVDGHWFGPSLLVSLRVPVIRRFTEVPFVPGEGQRGFMTER